METNAQVLRRVVWRVLLAEGLIMAVAALMVLAAQQPFTFQNFRGALFIVGGICAALGFLTTIGDLQIRGNWKYQFGRSVSDASLPERTQQDIRERTRREGFAVIVAIAGVLAMAGSLVGIR